MENVALLHLFFNFAKIVMIHIKDYQYEIQDFIFQYLGDGLLPCGV